MRSAGSLVAITTFVIGATACMLLGCSGAQTTGALPHAAPSATPTMPPATRPPTPPPTLHFRPSVVRLEIGQSQLVHPLGIDCPWHCYVQYDGRSCEKGVGVFLAMGMFNGIIVSAAPNSKSGECVIRIAGARVTAKPEPPLRFGSFTVRVDPSI